MPPTWTVSADPVDFTEAIAWFRNRVPIPDPEYRLLTERAKQRAFFVAGVGRLDILADVWGALLSALEDGTPYAEWAQQAGAILERAWGGSNPWHLETIFRTNVQHAYSAGRWRQMTEPNVLRARPYWMYDSVLDARTTEICRERNGVIRPADDPWWGANWPPLHHNCRSGVRALTQAEARARDIDVPLPAISPMEGFGSAPDISDWADNYAQRIHQDIALGTWESAFVGATPNWQSYGRPSKLRANPPPSALPPDEAAAVETLRAEIAPLPQYLATAAGMSVLVDADGIQGLGRYVAWLPDLVAAPDEIWLLPVSNGNVIAIRLIYVKAYRAGRQTVTLAAEFHKGVIYRLDESGNLRQGVLVYPRQGGRQ